jgi:hypothetical protein
MADARLERNWKMANAASDNVTRPSSRAYRDNYDRVFRKKPTKKIKSSK